MNNNDELKIGERLIALRKKKKITQRELAKSLNLSANHICSMEKNSRSVTFRTLKELCRIYNVNETWLLTGKGDMFISPLDSLDIKDKEIKKFMELYIQLDDETQKHVMALVEKALSK